MLRTSVAGSAYLGVFSSVVGDAALIRSDVEESTREQIAAELDIAVYPTSIGGGSTVGSLITGNTNGIIVSSQITQMERANLSEHLSRPITALPGRLNAAGNLILANETGAIVHPELSSDAITAIADTLDVPVEPATIGDIKTVGMAAVTTRNGVLCHPKASEEELALLDTHLGVPADIGTVNHGSPLVGSGLLATTSGYVTGDRTTGPELGRIEDALGLID